MRKFWLGTLVVSLSTWSRSCISNTCSVMHNILLSIVDSFVVFAFHSAVSFNVLLMQIKTQFIVRLLCFWWIRYGLIFDISVFKSHQNKSEWWRSNDLFKNALNMRSVWILFMAHKFVMRYVYLCSGKPI